MANGDIVRLDLDGRTLEIAALILPGQADFSVAVSLGYGRTTAGRVGTGRGFQRLCPPHGRLARYRRRPESDPDRPNSTHWPARKTISRWKAATWSGSYPWPTCLGGPVPCPTRQSGCLANSSRGPRSTASISGGWRSTLTPASVATPAWSPVRARTTSRSWARTKSPRGREMHWIRLDRYFSGEESDPGLVHQPVACVHCENAPCEVVCPVNATVHSDEGLNVQVYSRCIGTRYCSNNCPYKVRRFNYFDYNERPLDPVAAWPPGREGDGRVAQDAEEPRRDGPHPGCDGEVYLLRAADRAGQDRRAGGGRRVGTHGGPGRDDRPGLRQACPARAIVFGDLSDPESRVSKLKAQPRHYSLLGELNTVPRTTYLARVKNPNPKMAGPIRGRPAHERQQTIR